MLWGGVESLDNSVPADIQTQMHIEILRLIRRSTLWFLASGPKGLDIDATVKAFGGGVSALEDALDSVLSPGLRSARARKVETYATNRVPDPLARRVASLEALAPACDIVCIATGGGFPPPAVGAVYYAIGARFGFDWLRGAIARLTAGDQWHRRAVSALADDLYAYQTGLTEKVLHMAGDTQIAPALVDTWAEAHAHAVARAQGVLADLKTAPTLDLAMLTVAGRELRAMTGV